MIWVFDDRGRFMLVVRSFKVILDGLPSLNCLHELDYLSLGGGSGGRVHIEEESNSLKALHFAL